MEDFHSQYQKEYSEFIAGYKKTQLDGEDIGFFIVKMAHYYAQHNTMLIDMTTRKDNALREIVRSEEGEKPISVAKAEIYVKVTPEYVEAKKMEAHIKNIEQYINSLKSLQKGLLQEYSYTKN